MMRGHVRRDHFRFGAQRSDKARSDAPKIARTAEKKSSGHGSVSCVSKAIVKNDSKRTNLKEKRYIIQCDEKSDFFNPGNSDQISANFS
jgi:hypothetical protein